MQKYKSNIITTSGAAVRNVPVTVLKEDGSLASLFLDRDGNVAAPNPLKTGADGTFYFYAVNGRYGLHTTVDGVSVVDSDAVLLMDPEELTVAGPIATALIDGANLKASLLKLFVSKAGDTMTGNLNVPSINGGQLAGMRNRIINGNFMINQTGFTSTNVLGEYGPDCWSFGGSLSGATVGMSLFSDGSFSATGTSHLLLATSAAKASLLASDVVFAEHKIEGLNIADLKFGTPAAKTITLSFRCMLVGVPSGVISVALRNSDRSRSYVTTIDATNIPGTYSITIPGDSSGTWATNNSTGIHITWAHCCGSTYSTTTTGAWKSGNFVAATTQTNLLTAVNKGFVVTDVQLEIGSVATPFEHRSHGAELALCQRYYEEGHFELRCYSRYGTSNRVSFKVTKRAAPTLTISGIDFAGFGAIDAYADVPGIDSFRAGADWTSTPAWRSVSFYWKASARL